MKLLPTVAENLHFFRKRSKLTQEALGFKAGFHPNYIGRVERGEDNISILSLEKITRVLKIDPFLLLVPKASSMEVVLRPKPKDPQST